MPHSEDGQEVFVVKHTESHGDVRIPVLCERCGKRFFTSSENLAAVVERNMEIACMECVFSSEDNEVYLCGFVKDGKILERPTDD